MHEKERPIPAATGNGANQSPFDTPGYNGFSTEAKALHWFYTLLLPTKECVPHLGGPGMCLRYEPAANTWWAWEHSFGFWRIDRNRFWALNQVGEAVRHAGLHLLHTRKADQLRTLKNPFRKAVLERAEHDPRFAVTLDQLDPRGISRAGEYTITWRGEIFTEYQFGRMTGRES